MSGGVRLGAVGAFLSAARELPGLGEGAGSPGLDAVGRYLPRRRHAALPAFRNERGAAR